MKENKFNIGDTIVLKEGNVDGYYIVIACTAGDYVLVNKNGNHSIRVLSKIFVDQHSSFLNTFAVLVDTLAKADIGSEDFNSTQENEKANVETYNDKLVREHKELTTYLSSLYELKNKKYGDSFGQSVREFGYISALTRMSDKYNRLKQLIMSNQTGSDTDESLKDTLVDLANYCLMTVLELNHAKK